jgi:hypothetical protein
VPVVAGRNKGKEKRLAGYLYAAAVVKKVGDEAVVCLL